MGSVKVYAPFKNGGAFTSHDGLRLVLRLKHKRLSVGVLGRIHYPTAPSGVVQNEELNVLLFL